jgi:mxaJ protein
MMRHVSIRAIAVAAVAFSQAGGATAQVMPDMVSRTALRVCADPSNLPFSNRKHEGFENKIAEVVASALREPVRYFWAPSGPGFVRNTLGSELCDVIMGYTIGSEFVQSTNPYYRSTYVIVAPKGSPLVDVQGLDDPKLKGHRIGVFAATPPVDVLLAKGLLDKAKVFPLIVDHRFDSPLNDLVGDLNSGRIDAAVVWGPLIGASVKASHGELAMSPLLRDVSRPDFSYRISFGIRHDEPDWKHKLEGVLRTHAADIRKVLDDYDVPLIDDGGRLLAPGETLVVQPSAPDQNRKGCALKVAPGFQMPGPAPTNGGR